MIEKDNSVNIKDPKPKKPAKKRSYHHGELRGTVIATGMKLLEEREADDLGLREIAREIGVSATALYRHFPNKDALLSAIAMQGMEMLGQQQVNLAAEAGGGEDGLVAMGQTYVRFAVENPALFRLCFRTASSINVLDADISEVGTAMGGLREGIAALMPDDMAEEDRKSAALRAWSLVHGLASLILDGQIEYDEKIVNSVVAGSRIM